MSLLQGTAIVCLAGDGSWLKHVPEADRQRIIHWPGKRRRSQPVSGCLRNATQNVMGMTPWGVGNDPACAVTESNMPPTAKFSGC
jgi:hypothetical protein